jgi:hypothetical protein
VVIGSKGVRHWGWGGWGLWWLSNVFVCCAGQPCSSDLLVT